MRALVCVLRHEGVRLRDPDRWIAGHLRTEAEGGMRRLVLRDLARSDETGVLRALYRPRLSSIEGDVLYFHGPEPMETYHQRTAAVAQEWAVRFQGVGPAAETRAPTTTKTPEPELGWAARQLRKRETT